MKNFSFLFFLILLFVATPSKADAYLDPGTGSVIIQVLVAGVAGIAFTVKVYWRKILSMFKKKNNNIENQE